MVITTTTSFIALLFTTLLGFPSCVAQAATGEGIATEYPRDQSIEKDPSVIYAMGFERGTREPLKITRRVWLRSKTRFDKDMLMPHHFINSPSLRRDEWICLEITVKLNDSGQHNGEQAFWIDGKKMGHWKQGSPEETWMRESFRTFGQWNKAPEPFEGFSRRTDEVLRINKAALQWYLSNNKSWGNMTIEKNIEPRRHNGYDAKNTKTILPQRTA